MSQPLLNTLPNTRGTVAVVGSGPSGFYATESLLKQGVSVALIERLPAPFGLVRYGVAPDHPKLKTTTLVYDRVARLPGCHFFGNVEVGKDISVQRLAQLFDAVVLAHGACRDRKIGMAGEDIPGCHGAAEFVGWYNGHPDHRDGRFALDETSAVIVGNGNVALDIARILLKPAAALARTDIAAHALQALSRSAITDVHIVGRRGPGEAKFSATELREIGEIEGCSVDCNPQDLPEDASADDANLAWFRRHATAAAKPGLRRVHFHFFSRPIAAEGATRLHAITFERTRYVSGGSDQVQGTGEFYQLPAGLLFRATGYRGAPIAGLPFDDSRGIIPTVDDRIVDSKGMPLRGLYATGWIKRGPSGIIGTNRADSVCVVRRLLEDLGSDPRPAAPGIAALHAELERQNHAVVDFSRWLRIDEAEVEAGKPSAKPREKLTRIADLLAAAQT